MLKKNKLGLAGLALGVILTAFGSQKFWSANADTWSSSAIRNFSIAFYIGIGLIVLSVALFVQNYHLEP